MIKSSKFLGGADVLDAIDLMVAEKNLTKETIATILEKVFTEAFKERYGAGSEVAVKMNRLSGEIDAFRIMEVVENPTNSSTELSLIQARRINPVAKIGDVINQKLPDIASDRSSATTIKTNILKELKAIEKAAEYEEYKDRVGQVVYGKIKNYMRHACIVGIGSSGKNEAVMRRDGMVPGEVYTSTGADANKNMIFVIEEVTPNQNDSQIVVSRSSSRLLASLLAEEIPEIKDGEVEIKAVARNAGSRSKVAVWSPDSKIDAVGACIGPRGSRIMKVVEALNREKIDIIAWDRDLAIFAKNAIVPAKAIKVEVERDDLGENTVRIVVDESELSLAIGKRGQNVKLAAQLLGYSVEVISEKERQQRAMERLDNIAKVITEALDVDDIVAKVLMSEGFISVEQIANAELSRLSTISGMNQEIATELQIRANTFVSESEAKFSELAKKSGLDMKIRTIVGLDKISRLVKLIEHKIISMQDLADLAADELVEILGSSEISHRLASKAVMDARKLVYNIIA